MPRTVSFVSASGVVYWAASVVDPAAGARAAVKPPTPRNTPTAVLFNGAATTGAFNCGCGSDLLSDHLDTPDSVRAASLRLLGDRRAHGESTHPFYWAAFVAAGDWR